MTIGITRTAVEAFIRRARPDLNPDEARTIMEEAAAGAERLPDNTRRGDQLWSLPGFRGRMIVRERSEGPGLVAVTYIEGARRPASRMSPAELAAEIGE